MDVLKEKRNLGYLLGILKPNNSKELRQMSIMTIQTKKHHGKPQFYNQNRTTYYTNGVKKLPKINDISIGLPPAFRKCCINYIDQFGNSKSVRISKKTAEVLLAFGIGCEE